MRIPEFSRVVLPDRSTGGAAVAVARAPYDQKAETMGDLQKGVRQVENTFTDYAYRQAQADNATAVNELAINFKKDASDLESQRRLERANNPKDFHKDFDSELQKLSDQYIQKAPSEAARAALRGTLATQRGSAYDQNLTWERGRSVENWAGRLEKAQDTTAATAAERGKNGQPIDDLIRDVDATAIAGSTLVEGTEKIDKIKLAGRQKVLTSAINGAIENNPVYAMELIKKYGMSGGGFKDSINVVMENEGGAVPVDGSSGAPAIYGINAKWHPEEYAAAQKITAEKGEAAGKEYAQLFYKKEFWDKNNIESLPAETQSIVLDGTVNHTSTFSKKLVEAAKSGASPKELVAMREDEYKRLATSNPAKYAESLPGWLNRLDKFNTDHILDPDKLNGLMKEAKTSIIQLDKNTQVQKIADFAKTNWDLFNKFSEGDLTLNDIDQLKKAEKVDDKTAAFMRESILKAHPVDAEEQSQTYTDNFDQVQQLGIKLKDGKVKIGKDDATLEDLLHLQSKIMKDSARGVTGLRPLLNKISPAILSLAEQEQGKNDKGFWNDFPGFTHVEKYDDGYEVIQSFLEKQGKEKDNALKANMLADFVEQADGLPENLSPQEMTTHLQSIANGVIAKTAKGGMKNIPVTAIKYLLDNPALTAQFDEMYGVGSAAKVLGK